MNEATRVLALYMDDVASGRIREDLAENCRLRWYTGNIRRSPNLVSEFFRFHILPQYSHIAFGECQQGNPEEVSELTQLYNLNIGNYETPSHRRNLNCITYQHKHLHRRAESDTDAEEDDDDEDEVEPSTNTNQNETNKSLSADDILQIKDWSPIPPPTTSRVINLNDDIGNGKNVVVITIPKSSTLSLSISSSTVATVTVGSTPQPPQELLRCIKTEGELHCSALSVSSEDAIIKVRLQIVYRFCTRFHIPEFVLISYERIGNDGSILSSRRPVRMNLRAHFDAVANEESTDDHYSNPMYLNTDLDRRSSSSSTATAAANAGGDYNRYRGDFESNATATATTTTLSLAQSGSVFQVEQTPPRGIYTTTKMLLEHAQPPVDPERATSAASRKRRCEAYVRNKRKAMRRLRL